MGAVILPEESKDKLARVHLTKDYSPLSVTCEDTSSSRVELPAHCQDIMWSIEAIIDDAYAVRCDTLN